MPPSTEPRVGEDALRYRDRTEWRRLMPRTHHQVVRDFLNALSRGELKEEMLTPDMSGGTVLSGTVDRKTHQPAFELLSRLFKGELAITIHSPTSEDDRAVTEFSSDGTLLTGAVYYNDYLFLFRIRDGQAARVSEYLIRRSFATSSCCRCGMQWRKHRTRTSAKTHGPGSRLDSSGETPRALESLVEADVFAPAVRH